MSEKKPIGTFEKEPKQKKSYFASDAKSIGAYILNDIVLPGSKKLLYELGSKALHMSLFGDGGAPASTGMPTSNMYWAKPSMSFGTGYIQPAAPKPPAPKSVEASASNWCEWDHTIFPDKASADFVLTQLLDILEEAGVVKVPALYDILNRTCPFTYEDWGWDNLSSAKTIAVDGGYTIKFPPARPIKK